MRSPATVLMDETRGLLTRLSSIRPIALREAAVPAAAISPRALLAIDTHVADLRHQLVRQAREYLHWLQNADSLQVSPRQMHRRYMALRFQFNSVLSQHDLFCDATNQRSEHDTGVWLSGLDAAATDALTLPGGHFETPPLLCYLDRGPGGAIRRARTRLPGGGLNPVAIIRVPRERMIGAGVASSLVHEAGHQGAALLDLVQQLRAALEDQRKLDSARASAWYLFERWISEIVADLWGVARVGVTATLGLMGVVGIPEPYQFRVTDDDPHPTPYIRVLLSCAFGDLLYPDSQWHRLVRLWRAFYPQQLLSPEQRATLGLLERTIPDAVRLIARFRPSTLGGKSIAEVLTSFDRVPAELRARFHRLRHDARGLCGTPPTLAFAIIGQARADGRLAPATEARWLTHLLTQWALEKTFRNAARAAFPYKHGVWSDCTLAALA